MRKRNDWSWKHDFVPSEKPKQNKKLPRANLHERLFWGNEERKWFVWDRAIKRHSNVLLIKEQSSSILIISEFAEANDLKIIRAKKNNKHTKTHIHLTKQRSWWYSYLLTQTFCSRLKKISRFWLAELFFSCHAGHGELLKSC